MFYFLHPVTTLDEVEELRKLRNECRLFMTRNTNEISKSEQLDWYNLLDKENNKLYLLKGIEGGGFTSSLGYGVIRKENDNITLSGGLTENDRNKGLGKDLFKLLLTEAKKFNVIITLEVLISNVRAKKIYESLGFIDLYNEELKNKGVQLMVYKND